MSEKFPDSQPVLALRTEDDVRRIEVWRTVGEAKNGLQQIESQVPEDVDGTFQLATMTVPERALSLGIQSRMAHDLAMDRNPTVEELDRGTPPAIVGDLGEKAPGSVGVAEKTPAQRRAAYIETLADRHDFGVEDTTTVLTLERSPDAEHPKSWPDGRWQLVGMGFDKKVNKQIGIFEKYDNPDSGVPSQKLLPLEKAFAYSAEIARERHKAAQDKLADRALGVTGPRNPEASSEPAPIVPFYDEFSNQISRAELNEIKKQVLEATAGVPEVARDKIEDLSPSDHVDVLEYRTLSHEQNQAHRAGDFLRSKDLKEAAFMLKQRMSVAAVAAIYN